MVDTIPNLWPAQFKINVQTPNAILQAQAGYLSKVTRGILEGAVETEASENRLQLRLVVIAPACGGYRQTLLTVLHHPDLPYPAEVRAEALATLVEAMPDIRVTVDPSKFASFRTTYPTAYNDEDLQSYVRQVLTSGQTMAKILSLIAKSNEARPSSTPQNASEQADSGADPGNKAE